MFTLSSTGIFLLRTPIKMKIRAIWIKFLPRTWVVDVSTLGPIGFWGKMPGTNGSIAGLIFYTILLYGLSPPTLFIIEAFLIYLSIAFCGEAELIMRKKDPSQIILDEFIAIPLCFLGTQYIMDQYKVWVVMITGFILFRFFDILKPFGIKRLQKLEGGMGVVIDDVAAALASCVVIHLGFFIWGRFM